MWTGAYWAASYWAKSYWPGGSVGDIELPPRPLAIRKTLADMGTKVSVRQPHKGQP
jgi:hypothetical protein